MDRSLAALQQTYADWQWIQLYGMPTLDTVVAYCTHCLPPEERAADSINQRIARQGVAGDRCVAPKTRLYARRPAVVGGG